MEKETFPVCENHDMWRLYCTIPVMTMNELMEKIIVASSMALLEKHFLHCLFFHPASSANREREHLRALTLLASY